MRIVAHEVTDGRSAPAPADPLLIDAAGLADMLCWSLRSIRRADASGMVPRPVRFGKSVRWRLKEIEAWVEAGCPDRKTWERMARRP
jgi:predicted DNA-binding transcriptional regulator AlpA